MASSTSTMAYAGDWKATQHYRYLYAIHQVEEKKLWVTYCPGEGWTVEHKKAHYPTWLEAVEAHCGDDRGPDIWSECS